MSDVQLIDKKGNIHARGKLDTDALKDTVVLTHKGRTYVYEGKLKKTLIFQEVRTPWDVTGILW